MISLLDLRRAAGAVFAERDPALVVWSDPHRGASPAEEEYSRVTDGGRWRVLGARADAWVAALVSAGVATAHPVDLDDIRWASEPNTRVRSAVRVVPRAPGALPLLVLRSEMGDVPDAGVTLAIGDPASVAGWIPHCGCDACDGGAQSDLDQLDRLFAGLLVPAAGDASRGAPWVAGHSNWRARPGFF